MTNFVYTLAKQEFMHGNSAMNLLNGNVYVALANSVYIANQAADQFFSAVVPGLVTLPVQLANVSITGGVLNAANVTFPAVAAGNGTVTQVVVYIQGAANTTSPVIAHIDSATGIPVTPNGGDISLTWDSGANKIFAL